MNELQIFTYNGNEVRTVQKDGEPWWVLKDVCEVLGIKNPTQTADRLDEDEKAMFDIGLRNGPAYIINESGLYNVILRSDKPEAKPFRKWVTSEVLPAIRKTGGYIAKGNFEQMKLEAQKARADAMLQNAKIRSAAMLERLAKQYDGTYKQVLHAHATKELTGEFLLPLPKLERKTFSAGEIGHRLGISANKVGILTNRHGLKTDAYGAWFKDKAKGSNKEVPTFRYYEEVIPVLKNILQESA